MVSFLVPGCAKALQDWQQSASSLQLFAYPEDRRTPWASLSLFLASSAATMAAAALWQQARDNNGDRGQHVRKGMERTHWSLMRDWLLLCNKDGTRTDLGVPVASLQALVFYSHTSYCMILLLPPVFLRKKIYNTSNLFAKMSHVHKIVHLGGWVACGKESEFQIVLPPLYFSHVVLIFFLGLAHLFSYHTK